MQTLKEKTIALPPLPTGKIVAVVNQKGGCGKTTTAGHFAPWLRSNYPDRRILFIDADGQQSASPWMRDLGVETVSLTDPDDLFERLGKFRKSYDLIVVDGPGNASEVTRAILVRADLALIPNRPSELDLASCTTIVRFVRMAQEVRQGKPDVLMFVNGAEGERSVLLREAREALEKYGFQLSNSVIYDRTPISDAPGQRSTVFEMKGSSAQSCAAAYAGLFCEALEVLGK